MRTEITSFLDSLDKKERRILKHSQWTNALATVDANIPPDVPIIALAFSRSSLEPGVLVVTRTHFLFVSESVQTWRLSEIDKITSDGKEVLAVHPKLGSPYTWTITSGKTFIPALTNAVNAQKFESL